MISYARVVWAALAIGSVPIVAIGQPRFVEVAEQAGVSVVHGYGERYTFQTEIVAGGVAAGDFDADGWPDLYVIGADVGGQRLFRNEGNGSFEEVTVEQPPGMQFERLCGPAFADIDGDNDLDLFVGTVADGGPALLLNRGGRNFTEVVRGTGMFQEGPFISAAFGDYDRDGDLDLLTTHWGGIPSLGTVDHLWDNDGGGAFTGVTADRGLTILADKFGDVDIYWSFTGNFVDIDDDGWLDILMATDFELSQIFRNTGAGEFQEQARDALTDENGMGVAIGDYDNDGDLDWFVSSISAVDVEVPADDWEKTGNRLYRNDGQGRFEDVSIEAGVRDGSWGWGACAADFDNDGDLDIFHVNGWDIEESSAYKGHPGRLFINKGDGSFRDAAAAAGIADTGEGRGVACFDYDRDGDIDVFISNNEGSSRLYRNEGAIGHFVQIKLVGRRPNTEGIGARISIVAGGSTQIRELRSGNNFVSQNPAVAHFGLGSIESIDEIHIRWPLGAETTLRGPTGADQHLVVLERPADANCDGEVSSADIATVAFGVSGERSTAPCPGLDPSYDGVSDDGDRILVVRALFAE